MAKDYHQPLQPLLLIGLWTIFCYGTKKKEVLLLRVRESTMSYGHLSSKIPVDKKDNALLLPEFSKIEVTTSGARQSVMVVLTGLAVRTMSAVLLDLMILIKQLALITQLRVPYLCHFSSPSFVLPIRPKYGILDRIIRVYRPNSSIFLVL